MQGSAKLHKLDLFQTFCSSFQPPGNQRCLKRLEDFANPSSVSAGLMHQPNVSPNANKPVKNMKNTKEHDNSKQNVY